MEAEAGSRVARADERPGPCVQGNSGLTPVNFQVNDNTSAAGSPGEVLSRRCVTLLKTALRPDMWAKSELKLQWFDKLLMSVVGAGPSGRVGPKPAPSASRGPPTALLAACRGGESTVLPPPPRVELGALDAE